MLDERERCGFANVAMRSGGVRCWTNNGGMGVHASRSDGGGLVDVGLRDGVFIAAKGWSLGGRAGWETVKLDRAKSEKGNNRRRSVVYDVCRGGLSEKWEQPASIAGLYTLRLTPCPTVCFSW